MKVLLVHDQALCREALAMLIVQGLPGVHLLQAESVAQALRKLEQDPELHVLLLDLSGLGSTGLACLVPLRARAPKLQVVVLSGDGSQAAEQAAIDAGAAGFVPKTARSETMLKALQAVLAGQPVSPKAFAPPHPGGPLVASLTPRQLEVLHLLIEGRSNKLISRELGLSGSTVKTHLVAIYQRLGTSSRTQTAMVAARTGLLPGRSAPASPYSFQSSSRP